MTFTVYLAGSTPTPATGTSATATISHAVTAGDTLTLHISAGGVLDANIWSVTDTKGNVYSVIQQCIASQGAWQYECQNALALTTSDTITATFSTSSGTKNIVAVGTSGAATTTTLVDQFAQATGSSTAPSVTSGTLGSSSELAIATFTNGSGGGAPTLAGGWTQIGQVHGSGGEWTTVAYQVLAATTVVTASATVTSTAWAAQLFTIAAQGALPARWLQSVAGAPLHNQFQVVSKLAGATSVRLKIATDSGMSQNVAFVAAQTPDQYGYVRHTAAGLTAQTQYFYQVADTPGGGGESATGPVGMCKTLPAPGIPANFTVSLGACVVQQASDTAAVDDWVTWNADLKLFTGDQNYSGTQSVDTFCQIQTYETQIGAAGIGSTASAAAGYPSSYSMMHGRAWGYYCRSDHEAGPDNGDSGPPASLPYIPANIAAARQVFPFGTAGDTANSPVHGLYQAWVVGRIRFIMIDNRCTDRSPGANTDDGSKSMLGAQQLAWFENQLLYPEPLKIIVGDVQWAGTATGPLDSSGPDKWWDYSTERAAILAFMTANSTRIGNLMWWHGDTHVLGCMTPAANATWGGFPVYCAAPMNNTGGGLDNAVWSQVYSNSGGNVRGYGRITITDDGHTIKVIFQGWDATNQVNQVTQTDSFIAQAPNPPVRRLIAPGLP